MWLFTMPLSMLKFFRMSVPVTVRNSILIQFSPAGSALDFPCELPAPDAIDITAEGIVPALRLDLFDLFACYHNNVSLY